MRKSLLFISILFLGSCFEILDHGSASLLKESINRPQTKKAVLFLNSGNATLDESLQVSIVDKNYTLSKEDVGNTFTVDSDHNATKLDSTSINLSWLNNDTLKIDYDKKLRTFIKNTTVDGIVIVYNPK